MPASAICESGAWQQMMDVSWLELLVEEFIAQPTMAERGHHQAQGAVVERGEESPGKRLGAFRIE